MLAACESLKTGAIAVSHLANVRYLCGFTGSNGVLLLTGRGATFYTDPRYDIQSAQECDCAVKVVTGPVWEAVAKDVRRKRLTSLALESEHLSHAQWTALAKEFGKAVKLAEAKGVVEGLRAVKSPDEVARIRKAVLLGSAAYEKALALVSEGMTEQQVAAEIDHAMRLLGAEGPAFETIVAAGKRSALPHARPTGAKIRRNQLLLVDMGACLDGYMSDMTRVAYVGRLGGRLSAQARRVYDAVLEAQLAGIAAVKPGARCKDVDAAARKSLKQRGLDRFFTHSLGHGLGLEIHETPRLGGKVESELKPGMVVTIEPGVYLPEFGGVRIEDTVLVTESGVEVLTPTSKEFAVIA
ncbi:MAG: aminopeptidase P family protein [Acidobacteria bacterium]|nr:aminopeptidase P family protein [Acidobacteriota bacterium]